MAQLERVGRHATTVSTDDNYTRIVYHGTTVVKFNASKIILDSGGWTTQTTKTRMNQASSQYNLGFHVYQKDYEWFVEYKGQTLDFTDGMVLDR